MADSEQLEILEQGIEAWNKWRERNPDIEINLNAADLRLANLSGAHLGGANLRDTSLDGANLVSANLSGAILGGANLRGADLSGADLNGADLSDAFFSGVNLTEAHLTGTNLKGMISNKTIFGNTDLSNAIGVEKVIHLGPSTIGIDTIAKSKGSIPETFLRGCGLSNWEIEEVKLYNPDLSNEEVNKILYKMYDLRAIQALQISPLFISYSHADGPFVDRLERQLNKTGIRFWRDIHKIKAGRIETQIDKALSQNPTVLLILSKHSLKSDWVEHEVRTARELEKEMKRDVLCPVALDDSWKSSKWPKRIMEQVMEYNILDFSEWQDDSKFDDMFHKLIDGLELFYKG